MVRRLVFGFAVLFACVSCNTKAAHRAPAAGSLSIPLPFTTTAGIRPPAGPDSTARTPARPTRITGWTPLAYPVLAYRVEASQTTTPLPGDGTWVRGHDQMPRQVGHGSGDAPAWTLENRYLGWGDDKPMDDTENTPNDDTLTILDTRTGAEAMVPALAGVRIEGTLLTTPTGFAAVISGRNNLGNDSTDLELIDLTHGLTDVRQKRLHTQVPQGPGYDTLWTQSLGYELIAVSTGASTLHYRYDPVAYAVTLDGKARELFNNQSNIGYPGLTISPDGRTVVAYSGGSGGGRVCDNASQLSVGSIPTGPVNAPEGLPPGSEEGSSSDHGQAAWTPGGDLIVYSRVLEIRLISGPEECTTRMLPDAFYRCPDGRHCVAFGFPAAAVEAMATARRQGNGSIYALAVARDGTVALGYYPNVNPAHETVLELSPNGSVVTLLDADSEAWSG